MKERLSKRKTVFQKITLTIFLFFILSLPTPIGFLDLMLIHSNYSLLVIFQRILHFSIIFLIINKLLQDNFYLEFDHDNLFLYDQGVETKIPLTEIYYLELKRKYFEFDEASIKLGLYYYDEVKVPTEIEFYAYRGKKLNRFIELISAVNKEFEFKRWTLFG